MGTDEIEIRMDGTTSVRGLIYVLLQVYPALRQQLPGRAHIPAERALQLRIEGRRLEPGARVSDRDLVTVDLPD